MSRVGNSCGNSLVEHFFRNLKNEWEYVIYYTIFSDTVWAIKFYKVGNYSALRPHKYNLWVANKRIKRTILKNSKVVVIFS